MTIGQDLALGEPRERSSSTAAVHHSTEKSKISSACLPTDFD